MAVTKVKREECCGMCGTKEEMDFCILCADCNIWIHYACSRLPTYQLLCFTKTNRRFTCEKCCLEKYWKAAHWIKEANQTISRQRKLRKQSLHKSTSHDGVETDAIDISTPDEASQGNSEHVGGVTEATDVTTGSDVDLGSSPEDTMFSQLSFVPLNPTQQGSSDTTTTTTTTTTTQPASNVTNSLSDSEAIMEIKKEIEYLEELEIKVEVEDIVGEEVGRTTRTTGKKSSLNIHSCEVVPNTKKHPPDMEEIHQHSPEEGAVRADSRMSGQEQQHQPTSRVRRRRRAGKNHLKTGRSVIKEEVKLESQQFDKTFDLISNFKRHTLSHGGGKEYECQQCGKRFARRGYLVSHLTVHSTAKDFVCQQCGKRFAKKCYLATHTLIHSSFRKHGCLECGKRFTDKSTLNRHNLIHLGIRKHECQQCGRRFTQRSSLITHSRRHSGIRNYQCHQCGKRFADQSILNRHLVTHNGVKNWECQQCGKKFLTERGLNKHSAMHNKVRKFECLVCAKGFTKNSDLLKHALTHNGGGNHEHQKSEKILAHSSDINEQTFPQFGLREFTCDVCGKCFKTIADIAKHMQIHI